MKIDFETIKKFGEGDPKAFEYIYHIFFDKMVEISNRYIEDFEEAKDVVQKCFIKINKYPIPFLNSNDIEKSLRIYVVRASIDFLRYKNRLDKNKESFKNHLLFFNSQEAPIEDGILERIQIEIGSLTVRKRQIFDLFVFENLTHKEIAERLNISEGTSKSQFFKAKNQIRMQLDKMEKENFNSN